MQSPQVVLVVAAHVAAACLAAILYIALHMPSVGIAFRAANSQVAIVSDDRILARIAPSSTVEFRSRVGAMQQTAGELVPDHSPDGSPATIARWFDARDRLAAITAVPATLVLPGGQTVPMAPATRSWRDISIDVWLLLAQGCIILLIGLWLIVLRPRDWGARMFLISCIGLTAASWSGAVYDARALTADGTLLHAMQLVNFTGSMVGAAGLIGLYLCQPRGLLPPRVILACIGFAGLWGAATGLGWLPLAGFYAALLVCVAAFVAVFVVQWRLSRAAPTERAALRWVGVVSLIGTAQIGIAMAIPQFLNLPSLGSDGTTIVPLLIIYGSIAFGIGSSRLFELDRWTYRVILGAAATLGFLLIDTAIVALLHVEGAVAFALALLIIGYLYLPIRSLVWRRVVGRPTLEQSELFQRAIEVAFATSADDRRDGWRSLLCRIYDPLVIAASEAEVAVPGLCDSGAGLVIPATADDVALRLGFRAGGRRLFGLADVALAREVLTLMHRAEAARAQYARGVDEERQRIARDLHDDVCAVLLTSLHRRDVGAVRTDVRAAMAEIRMIISGLTGERLPLEAVVADLRHETASRLAAAGVVLDWPLAGTPSALRLLDYPVYKTLIASHREIISNIIKHARAQNVTVSLVQAGNTLKIDVVDDGSAPWDPAPARGNGLRNLQTRLDDIGGNIAMSPAGPGRRVDIVVPLD